VSHAILLLVFLAEKSHLLVLLLADIDECELDMDNCHVNATCADVFGSFGCTCNIGFEGDGVNCVGKTEYENLFCDTLFHHCWYGILSYVFSLLSCW